MDLTQWTAISTHERLALTGRLERASGHRLEFVRLIRGGHLQDLPPVEVAVLRHPASGLLFHFIPGGEIPARDENLGSPRTMVPPFFMAAQPLELGVDTDWSNELMHHGMRLPTALEWEWAYRGGTPRESPGQGSPNPPAVVNGLALERMGEKPELVEGGILRGGLGPPSFVIRPALSFDLLSS